MFLAAGAKSATCIDVFPWNQMNLPIYQQLVGDPTALFDRVSYRCPEAIETANLPAGSFDVIYSHAVLEHVYDPELSVRQIARLLRPGGVTSHQIDLRDHRDFDRPLEFLRYPDWMWQLARARTPDRENRWRRSDWVAAFEDAGLRVLSTVVTESYPMTEAERDRLAPRFRSKGLEDLSAIGVLVRAERPL